MGKQILTKERLIKDQHQNIQIIVSFIFMFVGIAGLVALIINAPGLISYTGLTPIIILGIFVSVFSLIGALLLKSAMSSAKSIKDGDFFIFEDVVTDKKIVEVTNNAHKHRWKGVYTFAQYDKLVERNVDAVDYNETQIGDTFYLLKLKNEQYVTHIYPKSKYNLDQYLESKVTSATIAYHKDC